MDEQLDLMGGSVPWEDATSKAQAKSNKKVAQRERQDHAENLVAAWMEELGYPVSVREMVERMEPVGLKPSTTFAAMKRLRNSARIEVAGEPDPECPLYQVLHNNRWQIRHNLTNH